MRDIKDKLNKPQIEQTDMAVALNSAAKLLIDQLPDHVGMLVEEFAEQYKMPLWQITAGILLEVYTEGRLSAFTLDPAWKDGFKQTSAVCEQCKETFIPARIGQKFCSEKCGTSHLLHKEQARRKELEVKESKRLKELKEQLLKQAGINDPTDNLSSDRDIVSTRRVDASNGWDNTVELAT